MKNGKWIFGFLLLAVVIILNMPMINAQKFKLHAPLKAVETPWRREVVPSPHIEYDERRQVLSVSGVSIVTRDMVEKYKDVTKVVKIGTDVREIGDFAFSEFKNLRYVYQKYFGINGGYENHVQLIGVGAFKNCRSLEAVFLINRSGVTILENAFMNCENLMWLNLYIKCVAHQAFVHCNRLKSSNVSDFKNIFYIAANAFEGCRHIGDIGERINTDLEKYIWNDKVCAVSFKDNNMILRGKHFDYWDIFHYFVALKEHSKSTFVVLSDVGTHINNAHKVSRDIWDLHGCRFSLCTGDYQDYFFPFRYTYTVKFDAGEYLLP